LASREVPVMVGLRLFLPESWTDDPERMARARVPKDRQTALTKPEIAIAEIDRVTLSKHVAQHGSPDLLTRL
jgi:SRSO17 transposase